jgi:predicted dehydrogenase
MSKPRIGFVGVGGMGQCAHLRNYAAIPDCDVVAIAEVRPKLAAAVAAKYGVPKVYPDHKAMLAAEKLDGIVASQPFTRHGVLISDLASYGVPIFTEKPLAGNIAAGQKVLDALAAGGSWHMVGYHKRSDPATMAGKAAIADLQASGAAGKMRYVRILMPAGDWVANGFTDMIGSDDPMPPLEWDAPAEDMDAPTYERYISFVNYYIHQVNLMRHLLGEPYKVVYADPTEVMLVVQSESGVTATIEMSPYTTSIDWQESALVAFERAWVKIDLPAPLASNRPGKLEVYNDAAPGGPVLTSPTLPWVHAMRQQAINFVRAVKGEIPPMCTAQEALQDLQAARDYITLLTGK